METLTQMHQATFSLTYAERLRAAWALTIGSPRSIAWLAFFPLCGITLLVLDSLPGRHYSAMDVVVAIACLGFVPFMLLFNTHLAQRADRRRGPYTYRFDGAGLLVVSSTSEVKQGWSAIPRIRERLGILLVYFDTRCAHCVPVRALGGHDAAASVMRLAAAGGVPRVGS